MTTGEGLERALRAIPSLTLSDAFWYALMAGSTYLFFHVTYCERLRHRRISERPVGHRQIPREILHSLRSMAIFGLMGGFVRFATLSGWTRMYQRFDDYGWTWFFVSLVLMILIHDTYFYWTHRLMHHRRLFKLFHRTHHLSTSPTPWAAYAFSPLEALVQAGVAPVIAFTVPVHASAFVLFMIWQISFNVLGHCGYEIYPQRFLKTSIGTLLNTPTHHTQHHEKFLGNFSLYFNIWDRLMGTNHATYEERFERATQPPAPATLPITLAIQPERQPEGDQQPVHPQAIAS